MEQIITGVVGIVIGLITMLPKFERLKRIQKAGKELKDLADAAVLAYEDEKISEEETTKIMKELRECVDAFRLILK